MTTGNVSFNSYIWLEYCEEHNHMSLTRIRDPSLLIHVMPISSIVKGSIEFNLLSCVYRFRRLLVHDRLTSDI